MKFDYDEALIFFWRWYWRKACGLVSRDAGTGKYSSVLTAQKQATNFTLWNIGDKGTQQLQAVENLLKNLNRLCQLKYGSN